MNAEVIGVSNDDLITLKSFAQRENISLPLVTDTDKSIKNIYPGGRITYLIDTDGIITYIQEGVPENEGLLEQLKMLK